MKKTIFTVMLAFICLSNLNAQVGIGTTNPAPSSVLDLTATNKGFLPPRMTTAQRDAIASPAEGLTIYNTINKCLETWDGTDWISICNGSIVTTPTTTVIPMGGGTTKVWLLHNLGADPSLDPNTPVVGLQGAYIQWGRRGPNTTGDSRVDWQTALNDGPNGFATAPTAADENAAAISGWNTTGAADGAWNSGTEATPVKTANDPCPAGFRVPTRNEWVGLDGNNTATRTGTFTNSSTEYGSALHYGDATTPKKLTLPAAGARLTTNGTLVSRGSSGIYWSSTENSTNAHNLFFGSSNVVSADVSNRTFGFSLRCIAE